MNNICKVSHGMRHVAVSVNGGPALATRPINVVVTEGAPGNYRKDLGLSMSRANAEILRDGLTDALALTKPPPTKAERITELLRAAGPSPTHREAAMRDEIRKILNEDGPL